MHVVFFMLAYRTLMNTVFACSMTNVHSVLGLKTRLCGHKPPVGSYVTSGNTLTVYFQSDVYRQEDGFEIVFTAFHEGLMYPEPHSILISFLHAHKFSLKHVTVLLSMLMWNMI